MITITVPLDTAKHIEAAIARRRFEIMSYLNKSHGVDSSDPVIRPLLDEQVRLQIAHKDLIDAMKQEVQV